TIAFNKAGINGGGINRTSGTATINITSTIVAGNTNANTPDINYAAAGTLNAVNSLIGAADVGLFSFNGTSANNKTGTKALPLNALLNPLANNGGQTRTHLLRANSPAVDAGSNPVPQTLDQAGQPRENPSGKADIGSFERVQNTPSAGVGTLTTI